MEKTKLHTYIVIIGQSSNVMVLIEKHARFCLIRVAEGDEMKRRMYSSIVVVGGGLSLRWNTVLAREPDLDSNATTDKVNSGDHGCTYNAQGIENIFSYISVRPSSK